VRDTAVRREVLLNILDWVHKHQFVVKGLAQSSIDGSDGNVEYLVWLQLGEEEDIEAWTAVVTELIDEAKIQTDSA
jgi:hypothetical protein